MCKTHLFEEYFTTTCNQKTKAKLRVHLVLGCDLYTGEYGIEICPRVCHARVGEAALSRSRVCAAVSLRDPDSNVDGWTRSQTGCRCMFDVRSMRTDCACCQNGGCQCAEGNHNQCVNCAHPQVSPGADSFLHIALLDSRWRIGCRGLYGACLMCSLHLHPWP